MNRFIVLAILWLGVSLSFAHPITFPTFVPQEDSVRLVALGPELNPLLCSDTQWQRAKRVGLRSDDRAYRAFGIFIHADLDGSPVHD